MVLTFCFGNNEIDLVMLKRPFIPKGMNSLFVYLYYKAATVSTISSDFVITEITATPSAPASIT